MKQRLKNTLRELTNHLGLKVKFVDYFDEETHGKLIPREKRILINARKPRIENIYTLLHEVGHYLLHVLNPYRKCHPRFFDIQWKLDSLARLNSKARRYMRFIRRRQAGKEWEADLLALSLFGVLARRYGARKELTEFLAAHPGKLSKFILVHIVSTYQGSRNWIKNLLKRFQFSTKTA